jgi:hypothetical protein
MGAICNHQTNNRSYIRSGPSYLSQELHFCKLLVPNFHQQGFPLLNILKWEKEPKSTTTIGLGVRFIKRLQDICCNHGGCEYASCFLLLASFTCAMKMLRMFKDVPTILLAVPPQSRPGCMDTAVNLHLQHVQAAKYMHVERTFAATWDSCSYRLSWTS